MDWATNRGVNPDRIPLLSTKLHPARVRTNLTPRPRLTERLDQGLQCKLTIVSAPAGFGKTTLLSDWAQRSKQSVAWVSLDELDNDPIHFWTYLIGALQVVQPGIGVKSLDALYSLQPPPIEQVLAPLINELAVMAGEVALVLDDYHVVHLETIHSSLSFFIERMPARLHLYVVSRVEPPLRSTRLRANGDLLELGFDEIRFTREESIAFLSSVAGSESYRDEIPSIAERAEGWIVGLQLIAMSQGEHQVAYSRKEAKSGRFRYLTDYMVSEVLDRQNERVRSFLLQTSILERFNGSLCDAVTGRGDSAGIIEQLADAHLFVVPLDSTCEWYRYHYLFAEVLRHRLREESPALIAEFHRRASRWFQQNGHPREAVDHMLKSGDMEQAALLAERYAEAMLAEGNSEILLGWKDSLPEEQIYSRAGLSLAISWALLLTGQFDATKRYLEFCRRALQLRPSTGLADISSHLEIIDDFLGSVEREKKTEGGGEPSPSETEEPPGKGSTGGAPPVNGLNNAFKYITDQINRTVVVPAQPKPPLPKTAGSIPGFGILDALPQIARLQMRMGELKTAHDSFKKAVQRWAEGHPALYQTRNLAASYLGVGAIEFERNDLDAAMASVTEGLHVGMPTGDPVIIHDGYVLLVRLHLSRGDVDGALDAFAEAERLLRERNAPAAILNSLETYRIHLLLTKGDNDEAYAWADEYDVDTADPEEDLDRFRLLTYARILILRQRSDDAIDIIARILRISEENGWNDTLIQALVLQTVAFDAQGDIEQALPGLRRALELGEEECYLRTFVREGTSLIPALERVREGLADDKGEKGKNDTTLRYIDRILRTLGVAVENDEVESYGRNGQPGRNGTAWGKESLLHLNPLSDREVEVLRLIADGKSNAAIAESLYVSVSTIKTHINNLYSKLGVESRTQALSRGRELHLL